MPPPSLAVLIVGGGAFGASAAVELRRRGHAVTLVDPGPLPHPDASSTDISKAVRMDYGTDAFYTDLAEAALERWRGWNVQSGETLFHETGFVLMTSIPFERGGFEADSFALLTGRGHALERLDRAALARRFPAWNPERYVDGYFNPAAGWAESGRVVARLLDEARRLGVAIVEGVRFARLEQRGTRVTGIVAEDGSRFGADRVVVAAGAWTPWLLPWLSNAMGPVGQPVLHFRPRDAALFAAERFPVWAADIRRTGWYGFPLNADGVLKVAHHGPGIPVRPGEPLAVLDGEEPRFRAFLRETFPASADAPLVAQRLCLYCDTFDGDFWIDHDPAREGLVVACGGSGHAFKFVPLLGEIVADVLERRPNRWAPRFAWREPRERRIEQARFLPAES